MGRECGTHKTEVHTKPGQENLKEREGVNWIHLAEERD
jgi:hypothetical protein